MTDERLNNFTQDWHWDKESESFAMKLGRFLLEFVDEMKDSGLSRSTVSKYTDVSWCIGILICGYGYHDSFDIQTLFGSPYTNHDYEFRRKYSCSKNDLAYYPRTWRKLHKYAVKKGLASPYVDDEDE